MLKSVALLVVCAFAVVAETNAWTRNRRSSGLIVGGENAGKDSFPEFALIYKNGEFFCGGTILNKRSILTATSPFIYYGGEADNYTVAVGKYKLNKDTGNEQYFVVKKLIFHPDFSLTNSSNDLAVVRVDGKIVFNDYVQPTVLSKKAKKENYTDCAIAGFGLVEETPENPSAQPKVLQSLAATVVVSKKRCRRLQNRETFPIPASPITNDVLCTKEIAASACLGDEGGPMGCYVDGEFIQYGVASYGAMDCLGLYVHTRVSQYKDWIKDNS